MEPRRFRLARLVIFDRLQLARRALPWALLALSAGAASSQGQTVQSAPTPSTSTVPAACSGPEFRQLDFWLGQWDLRWDAWPNIPAGTGTNSVTLAFDGCVVQEDFAGGPGTGSLAGRSLSTFHAPAQRWRQTWVDNQGGYFALVGGPEGERFVLTAARAKDGTPAQRMVFEAITARSLTWRWQATADAGATWKDQWVIHYTRAQSHASAPMLAERLLSAIGGRAAWAGLKNTVNDSQQFRTTDPEQVRAIITMDFTQPRWRIDTSAPGLQLTRVVDGERDWRRTRGGEIAPLSAATRQADLQWYAGHVYRTLARMARHDPLLQLTVGHDGRLEVHEGASRIAWFKLTAAGEPYAFGGVGDGAGSISGPWTAVEQGIRHPAWVAHADGTWRSSLNRLQVNVPLNDALFQRPD
jgi:hypothetical protein